jgi:hypothetical protein
MNLLKQRLDAFRLVNISNHCSLIVVTFPRVHGFTWCPYSGLYKPSLMRLNRGRCFARITMSPFFS